MVMQRGYDNSRDEEYFYDDGQPEPTSEPEPTFQPTYPLQPDAPPPGASAAGGDSFYSAGGYTPEQEAYMQSVGAAFNDLAAKYPGAAISMPDFMNPTYNQPSEDPNVEVDTWTPHYAPGSVIDAAMASGKTPEQMISNSGYGVTNYGKVSTGGFKTGDPNAKQAWLTPGTAYTLIDNVTGKQMGASASTPQELLALTEQAKSISNTQGKKADWSIVKGDGAGGETVAADARDPDKNLNAFYALAALAVVIAAPYALGALGFGSGAAGATAVGTGTVAGATTAGLTAAEIAALGSLGTFAGETALVTAPLLAGSGISGTLAAIAGTGALAGGLSTLATPTPVSPTAPPGSALPFEEVVGSGLSTGAPALPLPEIAGGLGALAPTLPTLPGEPSALDIEESQVDAPKVPKTITPYVIPSLPLIPDLTLPTLPGEPSALDIEESQVDAPKVPKKPEIPFIPTITPFPIPDVKFIVDPKVPTLPEDPDYLKYLKYLEWAAKAAALVGGAAGGSGGAGAGTGAVPGGSGLMPPSFATDKLPTGDAIPAFGGGTSPTSRTARDMGDIDWNRYGFGPEKSFFANVPQRAAKGGSMAVRRPSKSFAVQGAGDGRSDDIPAVLSDGEYVMDAETVALLGNGSNKAGAAQLDRFRANVRKHKGKALAKGRFSVNAKNPQAYMAGGRS
jgi:hypothetical protein